MSSRTRFPRRLFFAAVSIGSLAALTGALATAALAASPRSGELHVTKECSQYTGQADSYCTITASSLGAITAGTRVVYLQGAGATAIDSDIVLVVGPGNFALGHVHLPFPSGPGTVTLSGGKGDFKRFHADLVVTRDTSTPRSWFWNGTYGFGSRDDSDQSSDGSRGRGALHVTKECSQFTGLADTFCTITASSLSAITAGSRVVYLQASGVAVLDSDVVLVVAPGDFALGHCTVDNVTNLGKCRFSGGIGTFDRFRAHVDVSSNDPNGIVFQWEGTYSFNHDD